MHTSFQRNEHDGLLSLSSSLLAQLSLQTSDVDAASRPGPCSPNASMTGEAPVRMLGPVPEGVRDKLPFGVVEFLTMHPGRVHAGVPREGTAAQQSQMIAGRRRRCASSVEVYLKILLYF